ncbi:putative aldouronate transport system substrate-binding protein [Paenibacillus sp. 1_12]|uniref:extracellular solute-binding protein n=1 Tax=Paenibacillus sp. 1_12 TaxID=1566278 RepID=UPI0008EABF0D|nr:extracellular solute-binding protein [Paenibacillus sp. 1_12]SFM45930.1 putative aldouronate transport system substrate-binding protein [Paenibacillus sp. 1_12]
MRKFTVKRLASLTLAVLMISLLLSACSGNGGTNGTTGEAGNTGGTTDNKKANTANKEPIELTLFINHNWYPIKEFKGPIADKITEKTGVKLKVTVATDEKQLPVMIASGDLPDMIFTATEIDRLSNSSLSYSWNELIAKHAPDFKIDQTRIAVNTAEDGKFYTIRNAFATQEEWDANKFALGNDGNPGVGVRTDIMKELGNPPIKTLDDFVRVLEQVKSKYPDMVPLIMDKNWMEQYFKVQFGIDVGNDFYEQDGSLHLGLTHPKMLDYYKFMNSLYRKGLILAENFAFSNDQIDNQYAESGKAFAHMHTVSISDGDNTKLEQQGKNFRFQQLPTALTPEAVIVNASIGWSGTFITKNNKHPKESIQLMKYLASEEGKQLTMFGIKGEHWDLSPEGYPKFKYNTTDGNFINATGLKWWYLYSDAIVEGLRGYVPGTQTTEALLQAKAITKVRPVLGLIQPLADSNERTIKTKIETMITTEKVKIFLSKSEEEAVQAYKNMLNIAKQIGLEKYEQWATQQYAEKKKLLK